MPSSVAHSGSNWPLETRSSGYCKKVSDSHEHLFFQCQFSLEVWRAVKHQVQLYGYHERWQDIMDSLKNQGGPKKTKHCLALAASVYHIWRERNRRIFQKCNRPSVQVTRDICDVILKRMAWKTLERVALSDG